MTPRSIRPTTLAAALVCLAGAPTAATAQLANTSFESAGFFPFVFLDWQDIPIGQPAQITQVDITNGDPALLVNTGNHAARLFGQFVGPNATIVSQNLAAVEGHRYDASAFALHYSQDPIGEDDDPNNGIEPFGAGFLSIEFRDAGANLLEITSFDVLESDTPFDEYVETQFSATAPAGATEARFALGFFQANNDTLGVAYYDDADMIDSGQNLGLINPGWDSFVPLNPGAGDFSASGCCIPGWTLLGSNCFVNPTFPATGNHSLIMFGQFIGVDNTSIVVQDFMGVTPGDLIEAKCVGAHVTGDTLQGGNNAFYSLEFRDSNDQLLEVTRETLVRASTTPDEFVQGRIAAVAPATADRVRILVGFAQTGGDVGAAFMDDAELNFLGANTGLVNPSFDTFVPGGDFQPDPTLPLPGWDALGFNGGVSVDPNVGHAPDPCQGDWSAFLFGQFPGDGSANDTVILQEIPAAVTPGDTLTIDAQVKHGSSDPLAPGNQLALNIEWLDAQDQIIGFESAVVLDSNSPQDVCIPAQVSGQAPASKATAKARIAVVYTQINEGTGAGLIDDISFELVPGSLCVGDINGDGTTDVFDFADLASNFGAGPGATFEQGDITGDGFVDVFDFADLAADFGCDANAK